MEDLKEALLRRVSFSEYLFPDESSVKNQSDSKMTISHFLQLKPQSESMSTGVSLKLFNFQTQTILIF